jgi:phosphoribosylamine--glycine ligase
VIEEKLTGREASLLCFCDGQTLLPLPYSQDHKRRFENDQGPNTGGMGAFAPLNWIVQYDALINKKVLKPLEVALQNAEFNYVGILFIGLMFNAENQPQILEFNCRFGDPETQCLLPLLENDLLELTQACLDQSLETQSIQVKNNYSACVVITADAYPEVSSKDIPIQILPWPEGILLFQAGTRLGSDGQLLTNGGRLMNVVGLAESLQQAVYLAYQGVESIVFEGKGYRQDIAASALTHLSSSKIMEPVSA